MIIIYTCRVQRNLAKEVLCAHYDDLMVEITHPYSLVTTLLQRRLVEHCVGNAMLAEYLTAREKMVVLVDALISAISKQPRDFHTLMRALEDKQQHYGIAKLLQQSHGMLKGKQLTIMTSLLMLVSIRA